MDTFYDYYYNEVQLSFLDHPFSKEPNNVLVICKLGKQWVLTKHKNRGLEFPGGKVEKGETAEEAAYREVMEETGAVIEKLVYIGQYKVEGKARSVVKSVYVAQINKLIEQETYFETEGPYILSDLPKNIKTNKQFSFIMKDDIIPKSLSYIEENIQFK